MKRRHERSVDARQESVAREARVQNGRVQLAKYLHLTSNNTIFGTQYQRIPKSPIPIVCDMSSDFSSLGDLRDWLAARETAG